MRIKIKNLERVTSQSMAWLDSVETMAQDSAKGLATSMLRTLIESSPQWSGDFASNWNLSVGVPDYSYTVGDVPNPTLEPWKQGSRPAIQLGLFRNKGKLTGFKLGQVIYITNASTHDTTYAKGLYDGSISLREVNRLVVMRMELSDLLSRYSGVMSKAQVASLKAQRV